MENEEKVKEFIGNLIQLHLDIINEMPKSKKDAKKHAIEAAKKHASLSLQILVKNEQKQSATTE
jgi:hypothetical protein